jgi:hypothetical protein
VFVVVVRARRGRPESRKDEAFTVGLAILIGRDEAGGDVMAGDSVTGGSTCAEWPYGAAEWGEQRYRRPLESTRGAAGANTACSFHGRCACQG